MNRNGSHTATIVSRRRVRKQPIEDISDDETSDSRRLSKALMSLDDDDPYFDFIDEQDPSRLELTAKFSNVAHKCTIDTDQKYNLHMIDNHIIVIKMYETKIPIVRAPKHIEFRYDLSGLNISSTNELNTVLRMDSKLIHSISCLMSEYLLKQKPDLDVLYHWNLPNVVSAQYAFDFKSMHKRGEFVYDARNIVYMKYIISIIETWNINIPGKLERDRTSEFHIRNDSCKALKYLGFGDVKDCKKYGLYSRH